MVPAGQISARIKNYPKFFHKDENGNICLNNDRKVHNKKRGGSEQIIMEKYNESTPSGRFESTPKSNNAKSSGRGNSKKNSSVLDHFMNEEEFVLAGEIDNKIPDNPGLYCIRIKDISKLPAEFAKEMKRRNHNVLYVGIATTSLKKRFLGQELRARGHGTFFRSLGAILGYTPPKGSLHNAANKNNYKFSFSDERKIINWINESLIVSWIQTENDHGSIETELIYELKPLINIAKNPFSFRMVQEKRDRCRRIANEKV
jgi:hypothetical protein